MAIPKLRALGQQLQHYPEERMLAEVEATVAMLRRELAAGRSDPRIAALYRIATGRHESTDARLSIMRAINHGTGWLGRLDPAIADVVRARHVFSVAFEEFTRRYPVEGDRLRDHRGRDQLIESAVRAWARGRGRMPRNAPRKWAAVAVVVKAAGLGDVDERTLQKLWEEGERASRESLQRLEDHYPGVFGDVPAKRRQK